MGILARPTGANLGLTAVTAVRMDMNLVPKKERRAGLT
jgi:hypothetical protein